MEMERIKRMMSRVIPVAAAALLLVAVLPAHASILFQSLGTSAPPSNLGTMTMTPFVQQGNCSGSVTTIPGCPIPGSLTATPGVSPHVVGTCGWLSWSHGYTGDVYQVPSTSVSLSMPGGTTAFYLYVEPNPFATYYISATTNGGQTTGTIPVSGYYGAAGFGFYTDCADDIATIDVTSNVNFSLGEFGISNASPPPYTVSFMDDLGRSQFCVRPCDGNYQWSILSGPGAPAVIRGRCQALNGGTLFVSLPGAANSLYVVYDALRHKANGYFYGVPFAGPSLEALSASVYSPLVDKKTTNDPPCGGIPDSASIGNEATVAPDSVGPGYGTSFMDDLGRSQFCVDTQTGFYQWFVLSGPGSFGIFSGQLQVLNGGTLFVSLPNDPNAVYLVYDVKKHKANGYFYGTGSVPTVPDHTPEFGAQIYSPLVDKNTTNDPPCGQGGGGLPSR